MQPVRWGLRVWCFFAIALVVQVLAPPSRAQAIVETPQQTNDKIKALSTAARVAPHDYVIGRGDLLAVEVFDVPEFTRELRVSQMGTIGLPLVPVRLQVSGLSEIQVQQKIAEILEANGLVSHPEVTVNVKEKKSKPITVVGAVVKPMVYEADRPVTLLEVLAEAGGIANDAGDSVIITRPDMSALSNQPPEITPADASSAGTPSNATTAAFATPPADEPPALTNSITVNLNELLEVGDARNNIFLQGGDIVTVPHAGIVYVLGAVARPGGFVVSNDRAQLSTLKALALAGGMNPTAKKSEAVIIRKDQAGKQHQVIVDLGKILDQKTEDVRLQASDILYVPQSTAKTVLIRTAQIAVAVATAAAIYRIGNY
jgi:polysaccharide biosynthesis/export protein